MQMRSNLVISRLIEAHATQDIYTQYCDKDILQYMTTKSLPWLASKPVAQNYLLFQNLFIAILQYRGLKFHV